MLLSGWRRKDVSRAVVRSESDRVLRDSLHRLGMPLGREDFAQAFQGRFCLIRLAQADQLFLEIPPDLGFLRVARQEGGDGGNCYLRVVRPRHLPRIGPDPGTRILAEALRQGELSKAQMCTRIIRGESQKSLGDRNRVVQLA